LHEYIKLDIKLILFFLFALFFNPHLVSSAIEDQRYDEYEARLSTLSLIDVSDADWGIGNPGFANLPNNCTIPFARIIDASEKNVSDLTEACAVIFDISPKLTSVVNIDGIIIKVNSYEPIPTNTSFESTLMYTTASVFYAEIDNMNLSQKNSYEANPIIDGKVISNGFKLINVYLVKSKPESFILRINAKTPGIYTFFFMILARYENNKERVIVTGENDQPFKFVFI
jgi:hypothetical protein